MQRMVSSRSPRFSAKHSHNKCLSSGSVYVEASISLGVLCLICFGGLELVTTLNRRLNLEDLMRRSAMSIQELALGTYDNQSVCQKAASILEDNLETSGFAISSFEIKACPETLGSNENELQVGVIRMSLKSLEVSYWSRSSNKLDSVVALKGAIFQKSSSIDCPEMEEVCQ